MDDILVLGSEFTTGANLAAGLADQTRVSARPLVVPTHLSDEEQDAYSTTVAVEIARDVIAASGASQIIYCGAAAESCWARTELTSDDANTLRIWLRAAHDESVRLTFVSSDAVFTGPRLFHEENSPNRCTSREARLIVEMEDLVRRVLPESLIVRTHAYGWSPDGNGYVETLVDDLSRGRTEHLDAVRHATPILATDLADMIARAIEEELTGTLHLGGAERCSFADFARTLADVFQLPAPEITPGPTLTTRAAGFGAGETGLNSKRVRNLLNLALPMVDEGLVRLAGQRAEAASTEPVRELIAA
ncbi:sugar nucleotide-binding protein [Stratiformator vulcanicus]|uniref:RmlD substrate binding domain protein n=1 Tax=Stratiformator vulcanicus TaxID=2527980 RepID=A0A517QZA5_9PLAN|nr:sugar nucleotide-binding protein [Stratiformator vulcanicus]QDT36938.1 RmlD substrate binding domain protein [Stratiformator vulcanicus]